MPDPQETGHLIRLLNLWVKSGRAADACAAGAEVSAAAGRRAGSADAFGQQDVLVCSLGLIQAEQLWSGPCAKSQGFLVIVHQIISSIVQLPQFIKM